MIRPPRGKKRGPLRRAGYAAVAVGLVVLMLLPTCRFLDTVEIRRSSFLFIAIGVVLVVANRALWYYRFLSLKDRPAYCVGCGWQGKGEEWFRFECCPECEEDKVRLL